MTCEAARLLMQTALDGDLPPGEAEALRGHLDGCEACARDAAALTGAVAALEALPAMPAPPELLARLDPELDRLSRAQQARRWAPLGALAAGLIVALSLGQFQERNLGMSPDQLAMDAPSAEEILEWVDAAADPVDFMF